MNSFSPFENSTFVPTEKLAEATRKMSNLKSDLSTAQEVNPPQDTKELTPVKHVQNNPNLRNRRQSVIPMMITKTRQKQTTKKNMHEIKLAFSEFYLSLILLQNYQTLNFTGFRKILKKHDKVEIVCDTTFITGFY